jgi:hypothetical protein
MRASIVVVLTVIGCGGGSGGGDDDDDAPPVPCTAESLDVAGTALTFEPVDTGSGGGACPSRLLASTADVADAFPGDTAPEAVQAVDFAVDRVVLGSSNPVLRFAVDDGNVLAIGEEPLCQGVAPTCVAYIVRGTTRDTLAPHACPYTGPDPCLAP